MKLKVLQMLFLFSFLSANGEAQIHLGVKGGLNLADIVERNYTIQNPFSGTTTIDPDEHYKLIPAFHAGVFSSIGLGDRLIFRPELLYSLKGARFRTSSFDGKSQLHYINLPLMLRYKLSERFLLGIGPELGYLMAAKFRTKTETTDTRRFWDNKIDFGLDLDFSVNISSNFQGTVRYSHGLTGIKKDVVYSFSDRGKNMFKNRVLQFSLSYNILSFGKESTPTDPVSLKEIYSITEADKKIIPFYGFKLGLSNYTLYGGEVDLRTNRGATLTRRKGLELGAILKLQFYKFFYSKVEINYLQKGGNIDGGGWVHEGDVNANYLNIPVLIGVSPIKTKLITLSIEGGIGLNSLLSSQIPYTQDIVAGYYVKENNAILSKSYGFEASTNAFKNIILFINYRSSTDLTFFHARRNYNSNENYDLWNKGNSITVGILIKSKND